MLAKNKTYYHTELEKDVYLFDYVFYSGTKEHCFIFDYGREVVKSNNLDLFLLKIKDKMSTEIKIQDKNKNYAEMQEILLFTMQSLKNGTMEPNQGKAIANVAQTLINSVKNENLLR